MLGPTGYMHRLMTARQAQITYVRSVYLESKSELLELISRREDQLAQIKLGTAFLTFRGKLPYRGERKISLRKSVSGNLYWTMEFWAGWR